MPVKCRCVETTPLVWNEKNCWLCAEHNFIGKVHLVMMLSLTLLHFPAINGNVKQQPTINAVWCSSEHPWQSPEPLTECQLSSVSPRQTGPGSACAHRPAPAWGRRGEGTKRRPGPRRPTWRLYLYLWALYRKMHSKNMEGVELRNPTALFHWSESANISIKFQTI